MLDITYVHNLYNWFMKKEIIENYILGLIGKELKPGDKIPSETELIKMFNISRTYVRRSVASLVDKSFLFTIRGSGVYVSYLSEFLKFRSVFTKVKGDKIKLIRDSYKWDDNEWIEILGKYWEKLPKDFDVVKTPIYRNGKITAYTIFGFDTNKITPDWSNYEDVEAVYSSAGIFKSLNYIRIERPDDYIREKLNFKGERLVAIYEVDLSKNNIAVVLKKSYVRLNDFEDMSIKYIY